MGKGQCEQHGKGSLSLEIARIYDKKEIGKDEINPEEKRLEGQKYH